MPTVALAGCAHIHTPSFVPEAWPHAFDLFLDAIAGKQDVPLVGVREAAARSAVMEALYEAARTRTWVQPK